MKTVQLLQGNGDILLKIYLSILKPRKIDRVTLLDRAGCYYNYISILYIICSPTDKTGQRLRLFQDFRICSSFLLSMEVQ